MEIEEAIKRAKEPKPLNCGEGCGEMYSPMDKLSIGLYGKCAIHFEENSHQEKNLFRIVNDLF